MLPLHDRARPAAGPCAQLLRRGAQPNEGTPFGAQVYLGKLHGCLCARLTETRCGSDVAGLGPRGLAFLVPAFRHALSPSAASVLFPFTPEVAPAFLADEYDVFQLTKASLAAPAGNESDSDESVPNSAWGGSVAGSAAGSIVAASLAEQAAGSLMLQACPRCPRPGRRAAALQARRRLRSEAAPAPACVSSRSWHGAR